MFVFIINMDSRTKVLMYLEKNSFLLSDSGKIMLKKKINAKKKGFRNVSTGSRGSSIRSKNSSFSRSSNNVSRDSMRSTKKSVKEGGWS